MPPVVDAHIHLFSPGYIPARWHDVTAERWANSVWPPRDPTLIRAKLESGVLDPDGTILMGELKRNEIDAAVCLGLDWGMGLDQEPLVHISAQMENLARMQRLHAGRFFAVCGVDPRRPEAMAIFERSVTEWGMKGFKMYPPCGYYPYDEVCIPFYKKAIEFGVPVVFHTALSAYPLRGRFAWPLYIADVQRAFPELSIVLAHAGHPIWGEEAIAMAARHPRTYLELSNWNEKIAHEPEELTRTLLKMRDRVGAHRIIFGTDHFGGPRFSGDKSIIPSFLNFIRELPERARPFGAEVSQEEIDLILGLNAVRVFQLDLNQA